MVFKNFEALIKKIEEDLGATFNKNFRETRKQLAGLTNLPNFIVFSEFDKDRSEWVYNRGGKKEIQYHIFLRNGQLGYGLGINSQRGAFNNDDPAEIANSFGDAFKNLLDEIVDLLPSYKFTIGSESMLGKMIEGDFLLFGTSIPYTDDNKLDDYDYQMLIADLKKQFEVYKIVFELNNSKKQKQLLNNKQTKVMRNFTNLLQYKKQIILQGPPGTGKTRLAKELAKTIIYENKIDSKTFSVKTLTKDFIQSHLVIGQKIEGKNNTLFEVVDLQKNVVILKSETSKPWKPSYNKILDSFNNKLWEIKGRTGGFKSYEDAIAKYFYEVHLDSISELEKSVIEEKDFLNIIQFHPSYTYEDFVRGIVAKPNEELEGIIYEAENKTLGKFAENALNDLDNKYVLIIDEINRANLSSVLGELIYALEYRGEEVESMYEVDGSQKLILPPNLYIIGTMNTADRSVGHIDYAVRRRFAFVDVPPEELQDDDDIYFNTADFLRISSLFNDKNVSNEFEIEAVQIGHSYFIVKKSDAKYEAQRDELFKIKMEYEVKPILLEYERDGILIGEFDGKPIKKYIKSL